MKITNIARFLGAAVLSIIFAIALQVAGDIVIAPQIAMTEAVEDADSKDSEPSEEQTSSEASTEEASSPTTEQPAEPQETAASEPAAAEPAKTEEPAKSEEPAVQPPAAEPPAAPAAASALAALLAAADDGAGKKVAKKCVACHTFDKGGRAKVGPNLWEIVGRDKASISNYRYSKSLAELGGQWTFEDLDAYITDPREFAPKNKMTFKGIRKAEDRADLLLYLRSLSDNPAALPQ